jgi:hypothetical protein
MSPTNNVRNWAISVPLFKLLRVDEQKGRQNSPRSKKKNVIIAPADSCPGVPGLMKTRTLVMSSFLGGHIYLLY